MKYLLAVSTLFITTVVPGFAQQASSPPTVTVSTADLSYVVDFLRNGGSHKEGSYLADRLSTEAMADLAKQKEIQSKAATSPDNPVK